MSSATNTAVRFASFREFYPFYLGEHSNLACRRLHFIGSTLVLAVIVAAIALRNPWLLAAIPFCGYGFAWVGHFFFEHNRDLHLSAVESDGRLGDVLADSHRAHPLLKHDFSL